MTSRKRVSQKAGTAHSTPSSDHQKKSPAKAKAEASSRLRGANR